VVAGGTVAISDPTQTRPSVTVDLDTPDLLLAKAGPGVTVTRRGRGWRIVVDTTGRHGNAATACFH